MALSEHETPRYPLAVELSGQIWSMCALPQFELDAIGVTEVAARLSLKRAFEYFHRLGAEDDSALCQDSMHVRYVVDL